MKWRFPVLLRICEYLDCNIGDICDAVKVENGKEVLQMPFAKIVAKKCRKMQSFVLGAVRQPKLVQTLNGCYI